MYAYKKFDFFFCNDTLFLLYNKEKQKLIYLKNATYVDEKSFEFRKGNIQVSEGIDGGIKFIDEFELGNSNDSKIIDCTDKLITRSFVNSHHHIYSTLARGMPSPKQTPDNFFEILKYVWWNLDKNLTLEMIEASALYTAIDCLKKGVTFVIDHHASPFAIKGSLQTIKDAFEKVGVSNLLCYEISDRDGEHIAEAGLDETETYLNNNQGLVGLHASFTVGNSTLGKAVKIAEKFNTGIHIHTAEDEIDQVNCLKDHNLRVIERFDKAGILNLRKSILAHCIHINENERKLLRTSGVSIVQNTESNQNNSVGSFSEKGLGNNLLIGTDGMHSDMLRSVKAAFLTAQAIDGTSLSRIYERFRKAHLYLNDNQFRGDNNNNLVIINYDSPTEINKDNFLGHFIYGINSNHIETVISSGKIVMKEGVIQNVDESEIIEYSRKMGESLWKKLRT